MHVWNRQQCRWVQWHGSAAAWRRLPHAVVSTVCSGTLAAVLALPAHKPAPTARPKSVSSPASYNSAAYRPAPYGAGNAGPWQGAATGFAAPYQVADTAIPPFTPTGPSNGPLPRPFTPAPPPPPMPPLIPPGLPLGPVPVTVPSPPDHPPPRTLVPPQPVPEPGSAPLLATGVGGLLLLRRSRPKIDRRQAAAGRPLRDPRKDIG